MSASAEVRAANRTVGEARASNPSKVLQSSSGNSKADATSGCDVATKGEVAQRPARNAWTDMDVCFQTDSCASCGQILLWCKCVTSDKSRTRTVRMQRTARTPRTPEEVGQMPTSAGTPVSSVWSSDDEKDARGMGAEANRHLSPWTTASLHPYRVRDRTSSIEGRELAVL